MIQSVPHRGCSDCRCHNAWVLQRNAPPAPRSLGITAFDSRCWVEGDRTRNAGDGALAKGTKTSGQAGAMIDKYCLRSWSWTGGDDSGRW